MPGRRTLHKNTEVVRRSYATWATRPAAPLRARGYSRFTGEHALRSARSVGGGQSRSTRRLRPSAGVDAIARRCVCKLTYHAARKVRRGRRRPLASIVTLHASVPQTSSTYVPLAGNAPLSSKPEPIALDPAVSRAVDRGVGSHHFPRRRAPLDVARAAGDRARTAGHAARAILRHGVRNSGRAGAVYNGGWLR